MRELRLVEYQLKCAFDGAFSHSHNAGGNSFFIEGVLQSFQHLLLIVGVGVASQMLTFGLEHQHMRLAVYFAAHRHEVGPDALLLPTA